MSFSQGASWALPPSKPSVVFSPGSALSQQWRSRVQTAKKCKGFAWGLWSHETYTNFQVPKVLKKGGGEGAGFQQLLTDLSPWGPQAVSLKTFFRTGGRTMTSWKRITPTSSGEWVGPEGRGLQSRCPPPFQMLALRSGPFSPPPGGAVQAPLQSCSLWVRQRYRASEVGS